MGFGILVQSSVSRFGGTSHFADDDKTTTWFDAD
jgi:hypothetical protein